LIGRLVANPEVRSNDKGTFCTGRIAVNHNKDKASFFDVIAFGNQGDRLSVGVQGNVIHVGGNLEIQNYETKDKTWRTRVQVFARQVDVFFDERNRKPEDAETELEPAASGNPF
jgi:single-stranded DNA-binding protein